MIRDFHSHILPGVDDGSKNLQMSLQMLQQQWEQGIREVIATPHFYPQTDTPERFLERRDRSYRQLQEAMKDRPDLPSVLLGAEVYYFRGIGDSEILPHLTIGGKKCILIEMPNAHWSDSMYRDLSNIWEKQGLIPVIAHLDRYIRPFHGRELADRLAQLPVYVQVNAESFLSRGMRAKMLQLLRREQIHVLGSDCHDLDERKPNLDAALEQIRKNLGEDVIARMEHWEQKILA